jgi:2-polyprenyl-6-methoxyphenol hydroxylase-like FAD-dependent oxidoreductase
LVGAGLPYAPVSAAWRQRDGRLLFIRYKSHYRRWRTDDEACRRGAPLDINWSLTIFGGRGCDLKTTSRILDKGRAGDVPVLVVGGGPVGLGLAIELGLRRIPVVLVETRDGSVTVPKMSNVHVRSMEFCRRWGIADRVIAAGWPLHHPLDMIYVTTMAGYELGRHRIPSYASEPDHPFSPVRDRHCPQLYFDPILRDFARTIDNVSLRYFTRFESFAIEGDRVVASLVDTRTGERSHLGARYLVGCDGAQSTVRGQLGIGLGGAGRLDLSVTIYIRSEELGRMHDHGWGRMYRFVDATGCWSEMIAIDGKELWRLTVLTGLDDRFDPHACVRRAAGAPFDYEILSVLRWDRLEFVADAYRAGAVFLAGDSAHQNSPTGGLGMNTGLADAVDLGWKLAAVLDGWGGEGLLRSYEVERRPVAVRNTQFCSELFYDTIETPGGPLIAAPTAEGEAARRSAMAMIEESGRANMIVTSLAVRLGYCYEDSPVIAYDPALAPIDYRAPYRPTTRPGARAPHAWLADGSSILDLYGEGFVLLRLGAAAPDAAPLEAAASARGVPLTTITLDDPALARLYERPLVLVRPDGHVAWRGTAPPADPMALIDRVRGA